MRSTRCLLANFIPLKKILDLMRRIIPRQIFEFFQPAYHFVLASLAVIWYGFPSRKLIVIGITGTKGKSTVVYLVSKIFERAGESVAAISSLGYKMKEKEWKNESENTMPGRFQIQKFLYDAVLSGARYVVLEVTSEGIKQFRHIGIKFDCALLTNLEPEHIERHGGFKKYCEAKQKLFARTKNIQILNKIDPNVDLFSGFYAKTKIFFHPSQARHYRHNFKGEFNNSNLSAAISVARVYGIEEAKIREALIKIEPPPGRLEEIPISKNFRVFIDYAHTPNSLRGVYKFLSLEVGKFKSGETYKLKQECNLKTCKLICVLGAAGGNRDKWKRPVFGKIAAEHCDEIILTDEDPYDEIPEDIIEEIYSGIALSVLNSHSQPQIQKVYKIIDRRAAIKMALELAKENDIVIITGKGSESFIHVGDGKKIPWSDREAVLEALQKLNRNSVEIR